MNIEKESLLKVGIQFGNLTQRWNPKMEPYIARKSGKLHLLDEQKIIESFSYVKSQLEKMIEEDNITVLFVGTAPDLAEITKQAAISCQSPYLVHRWPGGFLTNFHTIQRSIGHLKSLLAFRQSESFATLSKREQSELERKINKLKKVYEGVLDLPKNGWFDYFQGEKRINVLLFIVWLKKEKTALREAKSLGVPVMAICNTSDDPTLIDYIIPGNIAVAKNKEESKKAERAQYLINAVAEVIQESKIRKDAKLSSEESETIEKTEKLISPKETNRV
ncbi:30S ribosomal protein S2 [endosymbiont GvMRE of Glomus versiforme]|uniref:30S ribosomal protein S2 n=1 Tax=endosymbiont GvMRE of Glomus versiforme TaxID=2039283 RepID=UPI000EE61CDA|nr:30S ribosomal protein S2 [endosymbiont GvMRE of Glomus versiforme]RHZ36971.1 30S ribosomal protein S2 [endosymbiont GvMRE of Glomus versiforme]